MRRSPEPDVTSATLAPFFLIVLPLSVFVAVVACLVKQGVL